MEPVLSLKRPSEISFELCIICQQTGQAEETTFQQTDRGIASIKEATEKRKKLRCDEYRATVDRLTALFTAESVPELKWHRQCYSKYTHKNNINAKLEREQSPEKCKAESRSGDEAGPSKRRSLRSQSKRMDWTLCLLCQADNKQKTCRVCTINTSQNICTNAKYIHEVFIRIADVNDLIAAEGCYHPNCLKKFQRDVQKAKVDTKSADLAMVWLSQELRQSAEKGHVLELSLVLESYKELANELDIMIPSSFLSRTASFKDALLKFVTDIYEFVVLRNAAPSERQTLLVPVRFRHAPLSNVLETSDSSQTGLENIPIFKPDDGNYLSIVHVALQLRSDIMSHRGFEGVDVNETAEMDSIPSSVHMFVNVLLGGQKHVDQEFDEVDTNEIDSIKKARVCSIGQDMVYAVCGDKKAPPKHVGLGLTLHQATRSKKLVNLFHNAGHIVSYSKVLQYDTAMAEATLKRLDTQTGAVVPQNLVVGRFVHFSGDNLDINDSTLDGKNTFHATQLAAWQRGPPALDSTNPLTSIEPSKCSTLKVSP